MIHAAATQLGWITPPARAEHVGFGSVLDPDGQMLASREGHAVRLVDLIREAVERAEAKIEDLIARRAEQGRAPELSPEQRREVARMVGIGAIKYADLSSDRIKDYVYNVELMVRFEGDTAGYLQYVHARVRGIFRKAGDQAGGDVAIVERTERALALRILAFGGTVADVERTLEPHRLAGYLYDLATAFTKFYDACPILTADPAVRGSRLVLAGITGRMIRRGLELLGIETPDVM
jgi:arginyl-tRNA synthetase